MNPGNDPDVWVERNEIFDVRFGRWANGIKLSTMGGRVVGNTIRDCAQHGIAFNAYDNGPGVFPAWLFDNAIERCAAGAIGDTVLQVWHAAPDPNLNRPQTWYREPRPLRLPISRRDFDGSRPRPSRSDTRQEPRRDVFIACLHRLTEQRTPACHRRRSW